MGNEARQFLLLKSPTKMKPKPAFSESEYFYWSLEESIWQWFFIKVIPFPGMLLSKWPWFLPSPTNWKKPFFMSNVLFGFERSKKKTFKKNTLYGLFYLLQGTLHKHSSHFFFFLVRKTARDANKTSIYMSKCLQYLSLHFTVDSQQIIGLCMFADWLLNTPKLAGLYLMNYRKIRSFCSDRLPTLSEVVTRPLQVLMYAMWRSQYLGT